MVDVELLPARERGPRLLAVDEVVHRIQRLVRVVIGIRVPHVGRLKPLDAVRARGGDLGPRVLAHVAGARHGGVLDEVVECGELAFLALHVDAVGSHLVVHRGERALGPRTVGEALHTAGDRTFLDLLRKQQGDVPLVLRVVEGGHRPVPNVHVGGHGLGVLDPRFLVVAAGREDVVRPHGRPRHAEFARDDRVDARPQAVANHVCAGPAAQWVGAGEVVEARALRRRRQDWLPPPLERLAHVLADRTLQHGVGVLRAVGDLSPLGVMHVQPRQQRRAATLSAVLRDHSFPVLRAGAVARARCGRLGAEAQGASAPQTAASQAAGGPPGAVLDPRAWPAPGIPGQGAEVDHPAIDQIRVVVIHGAPADLDHRRFRGREFTRHALDVAGRHARDLRRPLQRVFRRPLAQQLEGGPHRDPRAIEQPDGVGAFQRRVLVIGQCDGLHLGAPGPGRLRHVVGGGVPVVEDVVRAVLFEVALAQEAVVVVAHQEWQVRLLLDELRLVQAFLEDHLHHAHRQRRVGAVADVEPAVGMDRGGAEVRCDSDDLGTAVAGLVVEVDVGHTRVGRVADPEQDVVGEEHVVAGAAAEHQSPALDQAQRKVADAGEAVDVGGGQPGVEEMPLHGRADSKVDVCGPVVIDDALVTVFLDHVQQLVGDLLQRLVPAQPLPLAGAALAGALHRILDPGRLVHGGAVDAAHRASTGVVVGDVLAGLGVGGGLFLAPDDPVLDVRLERAGGVAVRAQVRDAHDLVPGPFLAVDILPAAVLVCRREQLLEAHAGVERNEATDSWALRNDHGSHPIDSGRSCAGQVATETATLRHQSRLQSEHVDDGARAHLVLRVACRAAILAAFRRSPVLRSPGRSQPPRSYRP